MKWAKQKAGTKIRMCLYLVFFSDTNYDVSDSMTVSQNPSIKVFEFFEHYIHICMACLFTADVQEHIYATRTESYMHKLT